MSSAQGGGSGAAAVPEQQPTVRVMRLFKPGLHVIHANPHLASLPEIDINRNDFAISQVCKSSVSFFLSFFHSILSYL